MYAISVILDIDPDRVEDFKAAALEHARNSTTNEAGCLDFKVFQSEERPDRFYFHEAYADKAAVTEVHNKAPYMQVFGERTRDWIKNKEIACWDCLDG